MTIAIVAYALAVGSLVAASAAALDGLLRLGKRHTRGIWVAALGVTVLGTAVAPVRAAYAPALAAPRPPVLAPPVVAGSPSLADRVAHPFVMVRRIAARIADGLLARIPSARVQSLDQWLAAGWLAASLLIVTLLGAVHAHSRTARRRWPLRTLDGTSVRLAPHTGPAVMGLIAPEIVVPAWLVSRTAAERRLVLDHEREHLRARDPLVLAAGYAAVAVVPWHPAAWWMLARLRLAVELDCDARVLRRGAATGAYGALLIDLAGHGTSRTTVPMLGLTLTHLERRLIAMTPHRRPYLYTRRGLLAAVAFVAFAIACDAPVPTSPRATASDNRATLLTDPVFMLRADTTVYHIDGVIASRAAAESLQARFIPRMITVKSLVANNVAKRVDYWITTKDAEARAGAGASLPAGHYRITPDPVQAIREQKLTAALARAAKGGTLTFDGLVLIDGKPASADAVAHLPPDAIKSVNVIQNRAAKRPFADSQAKAVIDVVTKRP